MTGYSPVIDTSMMERSSNFKERRYIEELRLATKATALDCIIDDRFERIIYIVKPGNMGQAIGKNGENIRKLTAILGKRIELVEYSDRTAEFITNIFKPADVSDVAIEENRIRIRLDVPDTGGRTDTAAERAKLIISRILHINDIIITN